MTREFLEREITKEPREREETKRNLKKKMKLPISSIDNDLIMYTKYSSFSVYEATSLLTIMKFSDFELSHLI